MSMEDAIRHCHEDNNSNGMVQSHGDVEVNTRAATEKITPKDTLGRRIVPFGNYLLNKHAGQGG
jgi:hypothetical protein